MKRWKALVALSACCWQLSRARKSFEDDVKQVLATQANCHTWTCGKGYIPRTDHHELNGTSDSECCNATCELWDCGEGFKTNEEYYGNVGNSNPECCDKVCSTVTCDPGYAIPPSKLNSPGTTKEECCEKTCALVACVAPKTYSKNKSLLINSTQEECCDDTCASQGCPKNYVSIEATVTSSVTEVSTCCQPTCAAFDCPNGLEMLPDMQDIRVDVDASPAARTSKCCVSRCSNHTCGTGWRESGEDKHCTTHPCTDQQCCIQKCSNYTCPDHYVKNFENNESWPTSTEKCCLQTCALQNCSTEGFVQGINAKKAEVVADTDEACCEKYCNLHTCSKGVLMPNASEIVGTSDPVCCENETCALFQRNMTETATAGCNEVVNGTECGTSYTTLNNTVTNMSEQIACKYDSVLGLCVVGDLKKPSDCSVTVAEPSPEPAEPANDDIAR